MRLPWLIPLLAALPLQAAQHAVPARVPIVTRTEVQWCTADDGALWARGADYKAGFDANGAQFVPFLGSDAPRNYPLALRAKSARVGSAQLALEAQALPRQSGDGVDFARGALVERYELLPRSMEQSFVFDALPARGELVLQIEIATDLAARATPEGLEFANERGGVRCGRATAIDARGARCEAPIELVEGGITIRVPASFVEQVRLPLVVDPTLSAFVVTATNADSLAPDACFDVPSQQHVVVWEEVFSATDHDVEIAYLDLPGAVVLTAVVDATTQFWSRPRVASNRASHRGLVVAEVGLPGTLRKVQGRRLEIAPFFFFAYSSFVISGAQTEDKFAPDVGGDPAASGTTHWCVVWETAHSAADHDIQVQLVDGNGVLLSATPQTLVLSSALDEHPSISRSSGGTGQWHVAWQRAISVVNHDIVGANISSAGVILATDFVVQSGSSNDTLPCASSEIAGGAWLALFQRSTGSTHDIFAQLMIGAAQDEGQNLSQLEELLQPGVQAGDQVQPCVDSDGVRFAYAYAEPVGGSASDLDVYFGTLDVLGTSGTSLYLSELRQGGGLPGIVDAKPRIASRFSSGGESGPVVLVQEATGDPVTLGDIRGFTFATPDFTPFCFPGYGGTPACPCANPPSGGGRGCDNSSATGGAKLRGTGAAALSGDTLHLAATDEKPSAPSIFLQGTALAHTSFGMGLRCVGGSLKRLYAKNAVGGAVSAPGFGEPSVSARSAALGDPIAAGSTRTYLVYYRDPVVLGGCPASSTFNTTNSGVVLWRP